MGTFVETRRESAVADAATPNQEQLDRWETDGAHWVAEAERYDAMTRGFAEALFDTLSLQAGERVLDVGCGAGATAIEGAGRVRPGGVVLGVDISQPMLTLARERASTSGVDDVEFVRADAQVHDLGNGEWDAVMSKFGLMFFDDPEAAFANLARALRPGGRIAFTAWQGLMSSEWITVPGLPASAYVGMPEGIEPDAPGPFGLADPDRAVGILECAGFDDITISELIRPMRVGDDVEDALAFFQSVPFVHDVIDAAPPDRLAAALDAAREALVPYDGSGGVVMENNGAWLVSAQRR
jgi:SAM-dependent methyltransferase